VKLVNPTDDQLNAAFAEKVAGWKRLTVKDPSKDPEWETGGYGGHGYAFRVPRFTTSADAVLPYIKTHNEKEKWATEIFVGAGKVSVYFKSANAEADTLPKAAVIALLRAHGVEITYGATTASPSPKTSTGC